MPALVLPLAWALAECSAASASQDAGCHNPALLQPSVAQRHMLESLPLACAAPPLTSKEQAVAALPVQGL